MVQGLIAMVLGLVAVLKRPFEALHVVVMGLGEEVRALVEAARGVVELFDLRTLAEVVSWLAEKV